MNNQQLALASRRSPLLACILAGAALLVALGPTGTQWRQSHLSIVAQRLVEAGWFKVSDTDTRREIVLADTEGNTDTLANRASVVEAVPGLTRHMRRLDFWLTGSEDRVLGFEANDNIRSPFENGDTWSGEMHYGRRPDIDVIPLVRSGETGGQILLSADPALDLRIRRRWSRIDIRHPEAGPRSGNVFELMCGNEPGALVYRIADAVIVNTDARGKCEVKLRGQRLGDSDYCQSHDIPMARCGFGVLRPGDLLTFSMPEGGENSFVARYQRRALPSSAMVMRRNANMDKIPAPGLGDFVRATALDLGGALIGCENGAANLTIGCRQDLKLSLDYQVQQQVQSILTADRASRQEQGLRGVAAIVVMNSRSGEVLAMGGYSMPDNRYCPMAALCLLPVGSAAKPVFATAMIGGVTDNDLSTLKIPHRGAELSDILGLQFNGTVQNTNRNTPINDPVSLSTFLRYSDNHYIESMLILASGTGNESTCPMTAEDWYELDGKRVTGERPRSSFEDENCAPLRRGFQARFRPGWADKLDEYFGLTPYGRDTMDPETLCKNSRMAGNMSYDAMPWHALFQPEADRCLMANSGLQRNWMQIDRMRDFRTEAVPFLLGNNGGHWSAVKLAEAHARIVTGRAVWASFVYLGGEPASQAIDFSNGRTDARVAVSAGMAKVIVGTAAHSEVPAAVRRLRDRLPRGYALGVFAKTGTMQLPSESAIAQDCIGEVPMRECVGKAFVITLAVYNDTGSLSRDPETGLVTDAALRPRCAITTVVNFPRWNGHGGAFAAVNTAATLIDGKIGERLLETEGIFCGPRD
ncbi:hypothetical protein [Stakelama tenebrarum]|uniref:Uncharacterized protein n=1 Tax=Stakelama tenebrarum TaxID=2711215 RepID=A0A6G6Y837_9SPHN|nr:hypothetical protein [Sphingosinithalassobacter tenebrarum]QIG81080.1 hypothetical protein G5C33_15675 [Sphingosinithalassobacter tenebrarum]